MYVNEVSVGSKGGGQGSIASKQAQLGKLSTLLHASVTIISVSLALACFDNSLFSWHPVFMSLGFLLFMAEGIFAGIQFRSLDGPDRVRAIQTHALWQIRAFLCIAVGFGVIYRNKILMGKPHFQSTHGKCGLAAVILAGASPLLGLISFRRMGIIQKFPEPLQPRIKAFHRRLGVVTWLLALVTIELALPHKAVYKPHLTPVWQAGVALIGGLMLYLLAKGGVKAKAEDDPIAKNV